MAEKEYRYWTERSDENGECVGLCDGFHLVSWLEADLVPLCRPMGRAVAMCRQRALRGRHGSQRAHGALRGSSSAGCLRARTRRMILLSP